jgi:hypothetical protein
VAQTFQDVVQVEPAPPAPASVMLCFWQRRLASLPDPTKEGGQVRGLPGQMFLITPNEQSAEVNGDLAVVVYDDTPRPPGTPARTPEVWHYTRDTLKRLATNDERFGRSYAVFLPWPDSWRDVTAVKIQARYQSPGSPDLFADVVRFALDFSSPGGPVWTDVPPGQPPAQEPWKLFPNGAPGQLAVPPVTPVVGFGPPTVPVPQANAPTGPAQPIAPPR